MSFFLKGKAMSEEYLTVAEFAHKLGVSPRTVQRYCKDGRLKHKWVKGKRHKELRILPPIQMTQLPYSRRKNFTGTFDYLTKIKSEEITKEKVMAKRDKKKLGKGKKLEDRIAPGGLGAGLGLEGMDSHTVT